MTIEEIKELILWCKQVKVKAFSHKGISFELSDLAFIEEYQSADISSVPEENLESQKIMADSEEPKTKNEEDEELLFWSSGR